MDDCSTEPWTPLAAKDTCPVVLTKAKAPHCNRSEEELDTCGFKSLTFRDFFKFKLFNVVSSSSTSAGMCVCMECGVYECLCTRV